MARTALITVAASALVACSASAQPLTGSGSNLPVPSPNPGAPLNQARSVSLTTGGFTGTWTAPALSPWIGTFNAIGPVPGTTSSGAGITLYDFTTMGSLPTGTYFRFGDVDQGAGVHEFFTLQAFDSSGIVTSAWLDLPIGVTGTGIGASSMPGWSFNSTTGVYTIDGATVAGNPNIAFYLTNNVALTGLELQRSAAFSTFSLHAPIPTPGAAALAGLGGLAVARRRRS